MYCAHCRQLGRYPWEHDGECPAGLRQQLKLYEIAFVALLLLLIVETVVAVMMFTALERCV